MPPFELITAVHSIPSKEEGEDRVSTFGSGAGASGTLVCDGVGAVPGSGAKAEEVRDLGVALLSGGGVEPAIWTLDRQLERHLGEGEGATTVVLVCAEEDGLVGHLLLGNGAVLEIVPMEVGPGKVRLLWTSIALPQMGTSEGRPALREFLPPRPGPAEAEKGIRRVPMGIPRLYLACSDGFLSEEERLEGPAPDGTVWRQVPTAMARLLELLRAEWAQLVEGEPAVAAAVLTSVMERAVAGPEDEAPVPLDDDTTLGALFLRPREEDGSEEVAQS
jgi:hypothetical protein